MCCNHRYKAIKMESSFFLPSLRFFLSFFRSFALSFVPSFVRSFVVFAIVVLLEVGTLCIVTLKFSVFDASLPATIISVALVVL